MLTGILGVSWDVSTAGLVIWHTQHPVPRKHVLFPARKTGSRGPTFPLPPGPSPEQDRLNMRPEQRSPSRPPKTGLPKLKQGPCCGAGEKPYQVFL